MSDWFKNSCFVVFDLETSGAYPLDSEICEIGAIKWQNGKVIDEFSSLVKTKKSIPDEIIKIHGITNEMLIDAPDIDDVIPKFYHFIKNCYVIGHHIQFDMGFMAIEFEKRLLSFPKEVAYCTSLISRKAFPKSKNHKLQTLIGYLDLPQGIAHRALDDAKSCLGVFIRSVEAAELALKDFSVLEKYQGQQIHWNKFSLNLLASESDDYHQLIQAIQEKKDLELEYKSNKAKKFLKRKLKPFGIVLNPVQHFFMGHCYNDNVAKRFYLSSMKNARKLEV